MKLNMKSMKFVKMRILTVMSALLLIGLAACSSDDAPNNPGNQEGGTSTQATTEMEVFVYPDISTEDGVTPRLTTIEGDDIFTELYDPAHPEIIVYHYMNTAQQVSAFISASSQGMVIMNDDPWNAISNPDVIILSQDGDETIIANGIYNKYSNDYTIESCQRIDSGSSSGSAKVSTRKDDMDFARKLVMTEIINPMSEKIDEISKYLDKLPFNKGAKLALMAIKDHGLVTAQASLYSNDPEEYGDKLTDLFIDAKLKRISVNVNIKGVKVDMVKVYKAGMTAYKKLQKFNINDNEEADDYFVLTTTESYSSTCRRAQESSWAIIDDSRLYKPTVKLLSVDGQNATVCGNFTDYDGRFTVTGYYIYKNGSYLDKVSTTINGTAPYTFYGLEKGCKYQVTSFATVMGATYQSAPVEFEIEGDLELSQSSLIFSDTGGSSSIEVTLPADTWTWTAVSNSQWCTVSKQGNKLNVKVPASSETREAVITVTATSPKGKTQSLQIKVSQKSIGNIAMFKGSCIMENKTVYTDAPSFNFENKTNVDLFLMMMRMGNSTTLSFTLPLSGMMVSNWTLSNTKPSGSMIMDGYTLTMFNAAWTDKLISIDGTTKAPNNDVNDFTVKIDLSALNVKISEVSRSTGTGYPGGKATTYKSTTTLTGTLNYIDEM